MGQGRRAKLVETLAGLDPYGRFGLLGVAGQGKKTTSRNGIIPLTGLA